MLPLASVNEAVDDSDSFVEYGSLRLKVADRSGAATSLLADQVFNPAYALAESIETGHVSCPGGSVLEFGSASALPSLLLACRENAPRRIVLTDHSDVLATCEHNMLTSRHLQQSEVICLPHAWGDDVAGLIRINEGQLYDLVLLSDLLWLDQAAEDLINSLDGVLAPDGKAWIGAGDYTKQKVVNRFEFLLNNRGIEWKRIEVEPGWSGTTEIRGLFFNDDESEPSAADIRQAMAVRKARVLVWEARRCKPATCPERLATMQRENRVLHLFPSRPVRGL